MQKSPLSGNPRWAVRGFVRSSAGLFSYRTAADQVPQDSTEACRSVREEQTPVTAHGGLPVVLGVQVDGADLRNREPSPADMEIGIGLEMETRE